MKKEILKKVMVGGLVACSCFTMFGCDSSKDPETPSNNQEQAEKEITSVSLISTSLPDYIIKGYFDNANIKALIAYEDGTTKEIAVTEDMLSVEDRIKMWIVGQYDINITIGEKSVEMYANVVGEEYLLREVINKSLSNDFTIEYIEYVDKKEIKIISHLNCYLQ